MTRKIIVISFACGMIAGMSAVPLNKTAKQFLNLDGKQPPGYTHVVTSAPGKMIFISGRGGAAHRWKNAGGFQNAGEEHVRRSETLFGFGGSKFQGHCKINYYVTDLANTNELRNVRADYLDMHHPPAATLVQAGLGGGALVEIEAIAMIAQ